MNKQIKKYLSIVLLDIFTCNAVIVLKVHKMSIPVSVALQQVPCVLMTAGACVAGLAASIWRSSTATLRTIQKEQIPVAIATTQLTPSNELLKMK
jgi:hypothetical protein